MFNTFALNTRYIWSSCIYLLYLALIYILFRVVITLALVFITFIVFIIFNVIIITSSGNTMTTLGRCINSF